MSENETFTWLAFADVVQNFFGKHKSQIDKILLTEFRSIFLDNSASIGIKCLAILVDI